MGGTLLLNATYEPICVVPVRRAVVLVLSAKAEVVAGGGSLFRSASVSVEKPTVIRLLSYVKVPYKTRLPLTRRGLIARDKGRCAYCSKAGDTIDHVHPRSRGGKHEWENVVLACRPCNGKKGDQLLSDLGWKLKTTPYAPSGTGWLIIGIAVVEPDWEPYLQAAA